MIPVSPAFSWLGVSYYLSRNSVLATLNSISEIAPRGNKVVFDYLETGAFDPAQAAQRVQILLMMAQGAVEPMNMGFNPATIGDELSSLGLTITEDLTPPELQQRYFSGRRDKYYACGHAHLACAVVE